MDANIVFTAIGSLGFPIVMCIALFWFLQKQSDRHKEEMDKMSEAINNNTKVMTNILDEIKKGK